MSSFYIHISWFFFLFLSLSLSLSFSLFLSFSLSLFNLSFPLFSSVFFDNSLSLSLDVFSSWFLTVVLLISMVISVYSYFYIAPYSKSTYFLWLTMLFVASMLIVVVVSNLFFVMLGWDGLGLISFFLIVYYQNSSSIVSGLFTVLMNRMGDCFFMLSLVLLFYNSNDLMFSSSYLSDTITIFILVATFITNSAIFPFSPWLPIAIAAPTPISALVHSSTLVTSGLYLIMRYSYIIYSSYFITNILLVFCIFTSFYAGLNALFESDLNNLIALSTLSHLGFIGIAFSCGLLSLSFFHLLVHALFNSLLFITIGDIITNLNHSQDIRYLSNGSIATPFSSLVMSVCLFNLLGIPSLSGFFSNDLILELLNYNSFSFSCSLIVYFNVIFTFFYTYQLFFYSFQSVNFFPYQLFHSPSLFHSLLLLIMSISTLCFGWFYLTFIAPTTQFCPVPIVMNMYPPLLSLSFLALLYVFLNLFSLNNVTANYYFSTMIFLSHFIITLSSLFYLRTSFILINTYELGVSNFFVNAATAKSTEVISLSQLKLFSSLSPINLSLMSFSFIIFFYLLN